jgi:hypothetical protein
MAERVVEELVRHSARLADDGADWPTCHQIEVQRPARLHLAATEVEALLGRSLSERDHPVRGHSGTLAQARVSAFEAIPPSRVLTQKLLRVVLADLPHLSKIPNGTNHRCILRRESGQVCIYPVIEARLGRSPFEVGEQDDFATPVPRFDVIVPTLVPFAFPREKLVEGET